MPQGFGHVVASHRILDQEQLSAQVPPRQPVGHGDLPTDDVGFGVGQTHQTIKPECIGVERVLRDRAARRCQCAGSAIGFLARAGDDIGPGCPYEGDRVVRIEAERQAGLERLERHCPGLHGRTPRKQKG